MAQPLRWGMLSTGGIAHTFATGLGQIDEGVAVAVGSRSLATAHSFANEFDIPHRYGSYEELVADPEVDVVYVGTPHPMHFDNAMLALRHGKHVLVEKAFTMTAHKARGSVKEARSRGLFLMGAMWTRFLPHVVALRELIARGALGRLVMVEADHGQWFALDPTLRLFAPELSGGALLDLGSLVHLQLGRNLRQY
jgi:predicted dehydrogenase